MKMSLLLPLLLLLLVGTGQALNLRLQGRHGRLGLPAGRWSGSLPPEQWMLQKLDHFNAADTHTWKQRYWVNGSFYQPGGPVFLMIGGEGTADPIWMVEGQWVEYARQHHALMLMLEHRYYGKSHPTADLSVANLQHLSSQQALADLAAFRSYIGQKKGVAANKWVAFGGSYPGSLAAWVRLKYPHLIHASVSTSAPMVAQLNFKGYMAVVRDSLATTGFACNQVIAKATKAVEDMLHTTSGATQLKTIFKLCDAIDVNNVDDVSNLFSLLAGNFENVVQYNKDNRAFEGAVGTNVTMETLCGMMANVSLGQPLKRYAAVNSLTLTTYKTPCLDFKYLNTVKQLQQTAWNSSASEGGRQWIYQTCTEFGFYQSSDDKSQPFGQHFPLSFLVKLCADVYGKLFSESFVAGAVNRTNTLYGGRGVKVTRVLFVNGNVDPWHALGITKDLSARAPAILINGTAHCANMYPSSPNDPPQLTEARKRIAQHITQWLAE